MKDIENRALSIIENYCGQPFTERQVNERTPLLGMIGRLTHGPVVKIVAVKARTNEWQFASVFGNTVWQEISPDEIHYHDGKIAVPGTFLNGQFTEADVTYSVGNSVMPDGVRSALNILVRSIEENSPKTSFAMTALLTPEIMELLSPHIKQRG